MRNICDFPLHKFSSFSFPVLDVVVVLLLIVVSLQIRGQRLELPVDEEDLEIWILLILSP